MKSTRVALCLSFAFLFYVVGGAKVTLTNRCQYIVWPTTLTGDQKPPLSTTGFELAPGASNSTDLPSPWSSRFWAWTGCSNNYGRFSCATDNCATCQVECNGKGGNPLATLVQMTVASNGGQDFYDVSNVDRFNVPVSLTPQGGSGDCKTVGCSENINAVCPPELRVRGSDCSVIACKSACVAFNQPQYCCTGDQYNTPGKCLPTNYSRIFKNQCPDAHSYAYDNKGSTCSARPDYAITFCP